MVRVFTWENGTVLFTGKGGPDKILDAAWSIDSAVFCTVGIKHVYFWSIENGSYNNKRGIFGKAGPATNLTCVQPLAGGNFVAGGSNGMVYVFSGNSCSKAIQIHPTTASVHTLRVTGNVVITGGSDNVLNILETNLSVKKAIQLDSIPRSCDMVGSNIVVGLRDGSILELQGDAAPKVLMRSHSDGEVWGLSVGQQGTQTIVVTTGDDNSVKAWDPVQRICVASDVLEATAGPRRKPGQGASTMASTAPNQQARCVAINPISGHVAIAFNDGHWQVRQGINNLSTQVKDGKEPAEWTECMRYSPDGKWLALGSHDNFIYIYDTNTYALKSRRQKHSSFLTALDWSLDSTALHSTSGDYELLFWRINNGVIQQDPSGGTGMKDEKWATWSTHFGWPVQGIFGGVIDYTHINRVDRDQQGKYFAVGNDYGDVEIFNNPNKERSKSRAFIAHSEHVTNVKWSADGQWLFSTGGYDQCLMQWKIVR